MSGSSPRLWLHVRGGSGARPCVGWRALVAAGRSNLRPFVELHKLLPCWEAASERVARAIPEGIATRGAAADALVVSASWAKGARTEGRVWSPPPAALRDAGEECAARGAC